MPELGGGSRITPSLTRLRRGLLSVVALSSVALASCSESPREPASFAGADDAVTVLVNRSAPADNLLSAAGCAGVLVHRRLVLTAAHCVADRPAASLDVVVGGGNLCAPEAIDGQRLPVHSIRLHPLADARRTVDAALLELGGPADAEPVPLGSTATGEAVTAFGWGRPRPNGPSPCKPVRTDLTVVAVGSCAEAGRRSARAVSDDRHVCAAPGPAEDRNTCTGDSGDPLLRADGDGAATVVGLVSWGPSCEREDVGVYVKAAPLREWIARTAESLPPPR